MLQLYNQLVVNEFEHTKDGLFHTETAIAIHIAQEYLEIIPIVTLIYVNEFYQNNIGGKGTYEI